MALALVKAAEDLAREHPLRKHRPHICDICGEKYFRRDAFETWTTSRDAHSGLLTFSKRLVRACLTCSAKDRPKRFLYLVHNAKMKGERL